MVVKEIDGKEGKILKQIYNHYLNKLEVIVKNTENCYHDKLRVFLGK